MGVSEAIGHWLRQSVRLRMPSRCGICRQWPADPLCETCIARFAGPVSRCLGCALAVPEGVLRCGHCLQSPPPLQRCVCAVDYAWPWRPLLARFKFRAEPGWDRSLAWLMRSAAGAEDLLSEAQLVLPMPLSSQRLAERGYNQAWLLARRLAPEKADAGILLRTRDTPPQRTLARAQRLANLQGALAIEPLRAAAVRERRVLLIDDVMTSGASLHTAARVLQQAGAAQVSALVLARTALQDSDEAPPPPQA